MALRSLIAPAFVAARLVERRSGGNPDGVPRPRPSLGLAAKVVLDEVFFLSELICGGFLAAWDHGRLADELARALDLYGARGWLDQPETFHAPPAPLAAPAVRRGTSRGLAYEHLTFESGYEPHPGEPGRERWLGYEANRTAHAWILRHPGPPRPWLVCVHAYRMGFPLADFMAFPAAWFHHHLGLNVAFPVLPLHGPRTIGWRTGDGFLGGDYLDTIHMQAQAVWDVRRVLGWLAAEGAPAIGAYGISLGGCTTALLAALEGDLACAIAGIPPTDYVAVTHWNLPAPLWRLGEYLGFAWEDARRLLRVISPLALPVKVPHERRYLFAAMADRLVPPGHARDLWEHWERPRVAWYEGGHVSFGWESAVRALLADALERSGMLRPRG
jgi:hypothetical protein